MATSVKDVAERAGVSVGTVSNVLNAPHKVAPDTVTRVRAAIDELHFVRNDAARQLRAGSSRSIGLLVLDVTNPFFTDIARGVEEGADRAGLSVLLANADEDAGREAACIDLFERHRVRGLLITPVDDVLPRLERLRAHGIPSVLVDRGATAGRFSSVSVDDHAGGRMAAQHLIATGRRRILFVGGQHDLRQVRDRIAGAREAVAESSSAVSLSTMEIASSTMREGVAAGRRIAALDDRPDAVFAVNDLVALGVMQGVSILGSLRIPDDIAIVGYDDIEFAAAAAVPITSIRQPRGRMGEEALRLLLDEIDGGAARRQIVFQPELITRESTRPGR